MPDVRVRLHYRANLLEERHERAGCRVGPMLYRSTGPERDARPGLGVKADRTYVDHGLTGTNRERPGLREALVACRAGDGLLMWN